MARKRAEEDLKLLCNRIGLLKHEENKVIFCALHDPQLISRFADYALSLNPEHPEGWNLRKITH